MRCLSIDCGLGRISYQPFLHDPRHQHGDPELRHLAIGRLQKLERMGLAAVAGPARWVVGLDAERTLRDLGMQGDIIKTMHRAFTERGQGRGIADYVIDTVTASSPIIGRLVGTGLHDELTGAAYAVTCARRPIESTRRFVTSSHLAAQ
jgi:type IV secretory pathway VirD2 relaxase